MKTNWTNVLIGAAVVFAVYVYFFRSTVPSYEGFESGPGAMIGMVFAGILGVGILIAFFAGASQTLSE
jgi:hypothetical protein